MPDTSLVAAAIPFEGFQLLVGDGDSPEEFSIICNVEDFSMPGKSETVDVTNAGDSWRRRIPTLLDLGNPKFKIFWVMTEPTHENAVTTGVAGLRYLWINQLLRTFKAHYPDDTYDIFPAYVTGFDAQGKVGDVFHATIELSNNGEPTLIV